MSQDIRIAYVCLNDLGEQRANVNQTLHMLDSLHKVAQVTFLSSWVTLRKFNRIATFFKVDHSYRIIRFPILLITKNFLLEKISRSAYCVFVLLYLMFSKIEIVYTRDFGFVFFLSLLPQYLRPRQKIIYEMHTVYHETSAKVDIKAESACVKIPDYIVTTSEAIKDSLISKFNINSNKISVLPNGVALENFEHIHPQKVELSKKYKNIQPTDVIAVYSGTFLDWKGVDILVQSAKFFKINNIKILLIGGTGDDKDRIDRMVGFENMTHIVTVDGFLSQKEVAEILVSSDIGIIPNKRVTVGEKYTSPLKAFEYMAAGLPVVVARLPSMDSILKDKINCLFFEPEDPIDLAIKIEEMATNKDKRDVMSKNNKNLSKNYSWDSRAEQIIAIIQHAILA